jgi:Ser/Thr protein kinase RdoA (MazF antagonist)
LNQLNTDHPYAQLTPDFVLDAVESIGLLSDSRILSLNSYENRVYQVGIEDQTPIIAKFYRPNRWTTEAILEEHQFTKTLLDQDISVVPPVEIHGKTLHEYKGFRFTLFPRQGGHAPEIDIPDTLHRIGLNIGRIHQSGANQLFAHRNTFSIEQWAINSRDFILTNDFLPDSLLAAYDTLTADLIKKMQAILNECPYTPMKLHGDCHIGNILWRDELAHFVDFDDCINGPAIQDLWLMLSGDRAQQTQQMIELIEGYEEFCSFDSSQLRLIETLRTLRMMNYAAWLARRWSDPAFPMHFPWFNTERYWSDHILELREQFAILDEPPLKLTP